MAWATLTQFKANQPNMAGDGDSLITLSLNATSSQITSCLYSGGYSVDAIQTAIAAGASFDFLVLLNIRLAAIDIMAGSGESEFSGANNRQYVAWKEWCEKWLSALCSGQVALEDSNDTTDTIQPPSDSAVGVYIDDRELGMDLTDPLTWESGDPVDSQYDGYEV